MLHLNITMLMGKSMSLNKISIYIETNTKIEYRKYTIYKATLYLKTILLKKMTTTTTTMMMMMMMKRMKSKGMNVIVMMKSETFFCCCYFAQNSQRY